jgi:hypothetical protein
MHIYEYLFSAVIIFLMLVASSAMIDSMPQPFLNTSSKEQLKIAAQKIMTQLTLDPGTPTDWGSNININPSELSAFGLAKYGESTREAYVLDLDKVQRLNSIPPSIVISLLNLGRDYGIELEFAPALNVTIIDLQENSYFISVTAYQTKLPIFNAKITAKTFYYDNLTEQIASTELQCSNTDEWGQSIVTFSNVPSNTGKILVAVVDYYGIRIAKIHIPEGTNVIETTTIGNHIILSQMHNIKSNTAYNVIMGWNVTAETYMIEHVPCKLIPENVTLFKSEPVEPSTIVVLAVLDDDNGLMAASKNVTLSYSSIPEVTSLPFAYTIERTVMIGDSLYTMRLQIWRMSW